MLHHSNSHNPVLVKFGAGGGKPQAPSKHRSWAVPWGLLQGRCVSAEVRTSGSPWALGPAACQAVVGSLGVWVGFWTTCCFVRDQTSSAVSPLGCLCGEGIWFGPLCCHLCSGCYHSPPLVASMAWRGPHCCTVVPSSFPTRLHPCWLSLSRTCCLETNMICFVLICRKTQLCPWGGQASPRPVHPTQPQSQISSSAPCWVAVAPLPPQFAPTLRWASSTHCVGRSRENPPGHSLPWDVGPKKPPAPFRHCLSSWGYPPATFRDQVHGSDPFFPLGQTLSSTVLRQGEAVQRQGHQNVARCWVGLVACCLRADFLPRWAGVKVWPARVAEEAAPWYLGPCSCLGSPEQ